MKFWLGVVVFLLTVGLLSWWAVSAGMAHDQRNAEETCEALGASSQEYVGSGHYLCLSEDGRILGRS